MVCQPLKQKKKSIFKATDHLDLEDLDAVTLVMAVMAGESLSKLYVNDFLDTLVCTEEGTVDILVCTGVDIPTTAKRRHI